MVKVSVLGASGYAGGELLRLLQAHSQFKVEGIYAGHSAGELIGAIHPQLATFYPGRFEPVDISAINNSDLVFLALPHGESGKILPKLKPEIKVVDLGADYRLENSKNWDAYYAGNYAGELPYGLPELIDKSIYSHNSRISNPGCYATAIALGAAPLMHLIEVASDDIVAVAASGTTGAGRSAKINLIGSEVMNTLTSYKFGGVHQHTPEIEQILRRISGKNPSLSFTPILAPMPRGILATITCKLNSEIEVSKVRNEFEKSYQSSPFVHLLPKGEMPTTAAVNGSNQAHIQVAIDNHAKRVIVSVAIDNLGKGAAGQAIQNANLLFNLPEDEGLNQIGVR